MKVSTRNQFTGTVSKVDQGAVNSEVVVDVDGVEVVSIITNGSVERLGIVAGTTVTALVKASSVILDAGDTPPKTSARNCLCGTVAASREGAVNGEVTVDAGDGVQVTAIVTNESIRKLGLVTGAKACALFKASAVILAVPD